MSPESVPSSSPEQAAIDHAALVILRRVAATMQQATGSTTYDTWTTKSLGGWFYNKLGSDQTLQCKLYEPTSEGLFRCDVNYYSIVGESGECQETLARMSGTSQVGTLNELDVQLLNESAIRLDQLLVDEPKA